METGVLAGRFSRGFGGGIAGGLALKAGGCFLGFKAAAPVLVLVFDVEPEGRSLVEGEKPCTSRKRALPDMPVYYSSGISIFRH